MLFVVALLVACGHHNRLGPPTPTGATILGGPAMTSAPPPPPGWTLHPVIPTSQHQAQDTVLDYLKRTLRELPAGTALDATRYSGGTNTPPCEDVTTGVPPVEFSSIGELTLPAGAAPQAIVAQVGEIWKTWGWYVFERNDFRRPNRFGYAPDGYRLQIKAKDPATDPPTLIGISPCFRGDLPDDRGDFPMVLRGD
jgi:hypothetical protein